MAKRLGPIDKLGSAKKPKLDVSVSRGQFSSATSNIVDFWANDDDDVVLLATQIAEEKQRQTNGMEFTFSEFAPHTHGTTSTQHIFQDEMGVEEIFGTDETFVFLPDAGREQKKPTYDKFEATITRGQVAQERQLKFLMDRVDVLKKENEKLHRDLIESNNQAGGNEGEVSLLRNELRQARKLLQASKMEKLAIAEEAENDCNKKVADVFKQVTAKTAELNFANVEFSDLKIRNANINERSTFNDYELSVTDTDECRNLLRIEDLCIVGPSTNQFFAKAHYEYAKDARGQKKQRTFFEMELEQLLLYYTQWHSEPSTVETLTSRIIESVCRVFTEFWSYTQSLKLPQNCMLYSYRRFDLQSDHSTHVRYSLIQPGALYNPEQAVPLRRYVGTLAQICREQSSISHTLLQKKYGKYWVMQIVIEAITKISYSSEVCEHFGVLEATAALLHSFLSHVNPVMMSTSGPQLELLCDLLKQLVFTLPSPWIFRELSACMLLCSRQAQLMAGMCVNSPSNNFISDRVRSVYRFGSKSCLMQVYAGLIELCFCSKLPLQPSHFKLLLSICSNHVRFVYSCFTATPEFILRMLSLPSLTDEEKQENEIMPSKVGCLHSGVTLTNYNSASSVNASAIASANISNYSLIPVQDPVPHEVGCECYVKLCLSVVTIVFQMMFQWVLQDKKSDISQVGEISHIAVHLLTLIFREYYVSCLFRDSEETTKHYLFLLCNWWKDHAQILSFEDMHLRFLRQLQDMQFMLKPLHKEANRNNLNNDFAEWTRIVCNADGNIPEYVRAAVSLSSETLLAYDSNDFFNGLKRIAYNFE